MPPGALLTICLQGVIWLSDKNATWMLERSPIGTNPPNPPHPPNLDILPTINSTGEGSLIWYDAKNETSIRKWTELLDKSFEVYRDSSKLEGNGHNQVICSSDLKPSSGMVCAVDVNMLGPCSPGKGYGYANTQPCFFLKLDQIYGWEPEYYNDPANLPAEMPEDLIEHIGNLTAIERNQIWVSCAGENPADREALGDRLKYYPNRGIPNYYFPYTNAKGYLSPLVAVQVIRPKTNTLINIECRAWAKNLIYRGGNQQREGAVHLELVVD